MPRWRNPGVGERIWALRSVRHRFGAHVPHCLAVQAGAGGREVWGEVEETNLSCGGERLVAWRAVVVGRCDRIWGSFFKTEMTILAV